MFNSKVRFHVCLWASLIATLLELTAVSAATACQVRAPVQTSAQQNLIGAGNGAALG